MQRYPWKKEFAGGEKYSSARVDPSGSAGEYRNNQMERLRRVGIVDAAPAVKRGGYSSFLNALRRIALWS